MTVVADTSPLNYLLQLGIESILPSLYHEVLIPGAVLDELRNPKAPQAVRTWTTALPGWIKVQSSSISLATDLDGLDGGERAAIELACDTSATILLIDERKARTIAESLFGFKVFGTLGVLQAAHKANLIDGGAQIERLASHTNFYVSNDLRQAFLASLTD